MTHHFDERAEQARADDDFQQLDPAAIDAVSGAYAGDFDFGGGLAELLRNLPRILF